MKIDLLVLGPKVLTDFKMLGVKAERLGFNAYLVGGGVRDLLLKQKSFDLDIVVQGDAILLAKALVLGFESRLVTYPQFGTATVKFPNGVVLDFASARSEHYPHPGALPIVKKGLLKEDLSRRDFTINALAVSLNPDCFGQLEDFYGGHEDLKNKKVRILHSKSFIDDPTRILRALRFASRFNFQLEANTLQLLKDALAKNAPAAVKGPRYFAEFRKIFSEKSPVKCLKRLALLHGLDFIASGFYPDWKTLTYVEKCILELKKQKFYSPKDWSGVFLLAFFSLLNSSQIKHFAKQFHLTKEEILSLSSLEEIASIIAQLKVASLVASDIYEILDPVDLQIIYFIRVRTSVNMVASRIDDFLKKWRLVSLQITGKDLKSLGLAPGRQMGALLHILLLHKIDGKIKNHSDELALAKRLILEGKEEFKNGSH